MAWYFSTCSTSKVIAADGGVTDSVGVIERVDAKGRIVSFDFGTCAPLCGGQR
jgi:hypothetical protein